MFDNIAFPWVELATVKNNEIKMLLNFGYVLVLIHLELLLDSTKVHRMSDDLEVQRDSLANGIHRLQKLERTRVGHYLLEDLFTL